MTAKLLNEHGISSVVGNSCHVDFCQHGWSSGPLNNSLVAKTRYSEMQKARGFCKKGSSCIKRKT